MAEDRRHQASVLSSTYVMSGVKHHTTSVCDPLASVLPSFFSLEPHIWSQLYVARVAAFLLVKQCNDQGKRYLLKTSGQNREVFATILMPRHATLTFAIVVPGQQLRSTGL
eukprot:190672-Pelagomonas_calceolata.AAC.3